MAIILEYYLMILLVRTKNPKNLKEVLEEALDNGAIDSSTEAQGIRTDDYLN